MESTNALMTSAMVEREFGIPVGTLRYWRHCDTGPASFRLGARIVYRRTEIERWITAQEKATTRGGVA